MEQQGRKKPCSAVLLPLLGKPVDMNKALGEMMKKEAVLFLKGLLKEIIVTEKSIKCMMQNKKQ